jgi:mRNA interferase MazF
LIYQWHIFLAALDPATGSEQAGTRPVLVISRERINQLLPVVNVIPLTSRRSPARIVYPNEVLLPAGTAGLRVDSIVLCYQIRTLDKSRLGQELGVVVDPNLCQEIHQAIRFQLEIIKTSPLRDPYTCLSGVA